MVSVGTANIPYIECLGYFESISFKTFETNRYAFQQPFPEYNEKPLVIKCYKPLKIEACGMVPY